MPVMRVLSHITLKSKIHLLNYSGILVYSTASTHNRKILELWSPALHPLQKNHAGAPDFYSAQQLHLLELLVGF